MVADPYSIFQRRFRVFVAIGKQKKILELVTVTLGFQGPIDVDSGMIINLSDVDIWIKQFLSAIEKSTHTDRWAFCKSSRLKIKKLINRKELIEVNFQFHDLFVKYAAHSIFFGWKINSQIKTKNKVWLSPITMTLNPTSKNWPPISKKQEQSVLKSLKIINLTSPSFGDKLSPTGTKLVELEYIDPVTHSKLRV